MAIPTSPPWNLAFFDESNLSTLLGLGPGDLSISPSVVPYFQFFDTTTPNGPFIRMRGDDGVLAEADFNVGVPNRFTVEIVVRFPEMPEDVGDLATRRIGFTLSDDASRGVSVYFSKNGIAVSRIDDFGSVTALPDTADFTSEADTSFRRIRIAVDGSLGRAYVFAGPASLTTPPLLFIIPVEETPGGIGDRFRLFVQGLSTDTAGLEFKELRLGSELLIPNFPPTANAGQDRVAPVGQAVRLDGRGSFDPEGAPITYLWRAVDAPFGSQFAHDNSTGSTSDDGDGDGFTDRLDFAVGTLPAWVAPGDVLVITETRHVIDTVDNPSGFLTVTTDTIPEPLGGQAFRIIRQSLIVGNDTETPYVVPDIAGLYRVVLTVNDGESDSEGSEVLVSVVGARAPLGIEPDVDILESAVGDEWQLVENREVFTEVWRGAAQILAGKLLEVWQHHYNYSIRDAQRTFQQKWIAYRTLIEETDPDNATISPRYGLLIGTHNFASGDPPVTGSTLVFEYFTGNTAEETLSVSVTLTGDAIGTIISDVNTALLGTGIEAFSITDTGVNYLGIRNFTRGFRLLAFSSAAAALGLETDTYNYLRGTGGARVTDRTYRVDAGINLQDFGVQVGDILSINNGQALTIERVITNPLDPTGFQRLITREVIPFDATPEWEIPSIVRSNAVDYELGGSYPGDLVKAEVFDNDTSEFADARGTVVAQMGEVVGARLDGLFGALLDTTRYEVRLLGVKRRKAINVDTETLSIPQLQDIIPQSQSPTLWKENIDYYIEPFYRNEDDSPIAMLQFRDSTFIDPDIEPPDIFWAELTIFNNDQNIENLFGRLVGFTRDNAIAFGAEADFPYAPAVAGLLYSYQQGPRVRAMQIGLNILFGQPFAEVAGTITEIRDDFTPTTGRILIQDDDGFDPPRTDVIRSYVYQKDPLDASATSGLAINPTTGVPYVVGDMVAQFDPLGVGVEVLDYKNSDWFVPFVRSGLISEIEKFFNFVVSFNLDVVSLVNLTLIQQLTLRIKPTYTKPILLGIRGHEDDVDVIDFLNPCLFMNLFDSVCGSPLAYMYDDYRGDGTIWTAYGGTTTPVMSPGVLIAPAPGTISDGETFVIDDGTNPPVTFEYDTVPDGVTPGNVVVDISAATTNIDVADAIVAAVNGVGAGLEIDANNGAGASEIVMLLPEGKLPAFYDGLVDCPSDYIELLLTIMWPGGVITFDSIFFLDTLVTDIDGNLGPPGGTFTPTYDQVLPAGDYSVTAVIDPGNTVLP